MVKILIVDDDTSRGREICSEIDFDGIDVEQVTTRRDALKKMSNHQYDLVILDIMLPSDSKTVETSCEVGEELLNMIINTNSIIKPYNIIGITSGEDVYEKIKSKFQNNLLPIFFWDSFNMSCKEAIKNKVNYLIKLNNQKKIKKELDIFIITAVESEYNAVYGLYNGWTPLFFDDDPTIYQATNVVINGKPKSIGLVLLPEMGMTSASCITTKIVKNFSPKEIYMIGICGGVEGEVDLDDIVISSMSWDYGSGKIKATSPSSAKTYYELQPSPHQINIEPNIHYKITTYKSEIVEEIIASWNSIHADDLISPKLHLSPMPSGAAVICDENIFYELIKPQHRKCVALDMETYGVYFAIKNSTNKQVKFFSVKCVSDFANSHKNDNHHEKCCYISANFLKIFLEKCD